MPSFSHTLIRLGPFADQGCKIVFDKTSVTVFHLDGHPILKGWRDLDGPRLWKLPLTAPPPPPACTPPLAPIAVGSSAAMSAFLPHPSQSFRATSTAGENILAIFLHKATQSMAMAAQASSTPYNPRTLALSSISALVSFYHACLGFPVKQTWLDAIKAVNCDTFDSLTYSNVERYCPGTNKTILGNLAHLHQNVWSTKLKLPTPPAPPAPLPTAPSATDVPSNQVFITVHPLSRLYTETLTAFH
jgi:hypothetical protein